MQIERIKKYLTTCIVTVTFFLAGCQKKIIWDSFLLPPISYTETLNNIKNPQQKIVVIFIHGTMLGNDKPHAITNRSEGIYNYQIINKVGIHPINKKSENTLGSIMAAENYTRSYYALHGKKNSVHCYTGGWDGRLDVQSRIRWGKNLYIELIQQLKKDGLWQDPDIKIELHGFSHGATVALNFAQAEDEFQQKLIIDRLCLWGMPVQQETATLVKHSLFKQIYHFYSEKDKIQIIDILSTSRGRSYKNFKKVLTKMPANLHQITLEINGIHPNHYEFWYLGTSSTTPYRKHFPLFPYPLVHFTPLFIELINNNQQKTSFATIIGTRKEKKLTLQIKPSIEINTFFLHIKQFH
ncbi:hypothetical protein JKY79_00115 [Candidatus Babeliales bacterium]|nr:hypothetical protein [Candidatus Babeliales bacterium]